MANALQVADDAAVFGLVLKHRPPGANPTDILKCMRERRVTPTLPFYTSLLQGYAR